MKQIICSFTMLLLAVIYSGCTRTTYQQLPNGSAWVVTDREFYPKYKRVVKKKHIVLPKNAERQIGNFYQANGFWPLSLEGFVAQSDDNRFAIQELYEKGFRNIFFVVKNDTLYVNFQFRTRGKLTVYEDIDLDVRRDITGKFVFTTNNSFVSVQKVFDKRSE